MTSGPAARLRHLDRHGLLLRHVDRVAASTDDPARFLFSDLRDVHGKLLE